MTQVIRPINMSKHDFVSVQSLRVAIFEMTQQNDNLII